MKYLHMRQGFYDLSNVHTLSHVNFREKNDDERTSKHNKSSLNEDRNEEAQAHLCRKFASKSSQTFLVPTDRKQIHQKG